MIYEAVINNGMGGTGELRIPIHVLKHLMTTKRGMGTIETLKLTSLAPMPSSIVRIAPSHLSYGHARPI